MNKTQVKEPGFYWFSAKWLDDGAWTIIQIRGEGKIRFMDGEDADLAGCDDDDQFLGPLNQPSA